MVGVVRRRGNVAHDETCRILISTQESGLYITGGHLIRKVS